MENDKKNLRIGVLDSGMGGLTVVRELERLLPGESVYYFGDSANCPYGNRPKEEILALTSSMLDFLEGKGIKIAAIACNTISAAVGELRGRYGFPIVSIIEAACGLVAETGLGEIGVLATEFTISQGFYKTTLERLSPQTRVYGLSSRTLAGLVDGGLFDAPETRAEVSRLVGGLLAERPGLENIVLGCTHYPIVLDLFSRAAPGITFINPALAQAREVRRILAEKRLESGGGPALCDIFTSGRAELYEAALKKLEIQRPASVRSAPSPR